jgi:hypothetical protein
MSNPRTDQVLQAARETMERARQASQHVYEHDPLFSPARSMLTVVERMLTQMDGVMQSIAENPEAEGVEQALDTLEKSTATLETVIKQLQPK